MIGLLTWPAYGTWLPGPARGRIDPDEPFDGAAIPEPDARLSASRRDALPWPPVTLDRAQRELVVKDLARLADLRDFVPRIAVAAADHVHLLLEIAPDRAIPRLVQLVKGSLSRTLSLAEGDPPPRSATGMALPHRKWWTHQYSFLAAPNPSMLDTLSRLLHDHDARDCVVRTAWSTHPPASSPRPPR